MNDSSQHSPYTITLGDNTGTETLTISAGSDNSWINMDTTTDQNCLKPLSIDDLKPILQHDMGGSYYVDNNLNALDTISIQGPTPNITYNYDTSQLSDLISIQPLDTSQWANLTTAQIHTLGTGTDYTKIHWPQQQEFVDTWPAWYKMQDMAAKYPAIKKALENLSTVYTMVKDDYDNPTPKR